MTKEELQAIADLLKPIKEDMTSLKNDVASLKTGQSKLEQGQEALSQKVTGLELKIENEINRAIKTIGEGHEILNRKLDEKISLDNRVERLEDKVSALEYAVSNPK